MEYKLGAPGKAYSNWAAKMAVGLGTGVPWVMCKQDDAPDPVVRIFETYTLPLILLRIINDFYITVLFGCFMFFCYYCCYFNVVNLVVSFCCLKMLLKV